MSGPPDHAGSLEPGGGPPPSGLVVQLPGAAPRGAYEALIARLGGEREIWAFAELVGRLAEVLYLEDVRAGGWLLDLGLWGSPVYLAAARDLILGCDGRVLRCMLPPDG